MLHELYSLIEDAENEVNDILDQIIDFDPSTNNTITTVVNTKKPAVISFTQQIKKPIFEPVTTTQLDMTYAAPVNTAVDTGLIGNCMMLTTSAVCIGAMLKHTITNKFHK